MESSNRKWWTLAAVSIGLFMVMLDNTVVKVGLPRISRHLKIGMSSLEWVVNGYTLSVGSGVVNTFRQTGGALGIAVMGAIVTASIHVLIVDPRYPSQFVTGLHNALWAAAAILAAGTAVALALIRTRPRPQKGPPGMARRPRPRGGISTGVSAG